MHLSGGLLQGQTLATLGTTAGEDLTAVGSSHSLAETVHLGALALLGLIGTEHCMTPPLKILLILDSKTGRLCRS